MGQDKPLIPIAGRPMLLHVLDALLGADLRAVFVVTRVAIARHLTPPPAVDIVLIENDHAEMIDSVRVGLHAARARVSDAAGMLVVPSDQPGLKSDDIRACAAAFARDPRRLVVASHAGKRGHPLIVPARLFGEVASAVCDQGLNRLVRAHPGEAVEVAIHNPAALANVNTPDDLPAPR